MKEKWLLLSLIGFPYFVFENRNQWMCIDLARVFTVAEQQYLTMDTV